MNDADLIVSLLTLGDPQRLTGGYLYHVRMAERAPAHGARIRFVSLPDRRVPWPAGPRLLAAAGAEADVVLVDSIVAAFLGPALALGGPAVPRAAMIHQPPGGIDHGRIRSRAQARLDRLTYRHTDGLFVASHTLVAHVAGRGLPPVQVVPPGRDPVAPVAGAAMDLREGRRVALLCVGNWVARKGIVDLLAALSRLPADAATLHLVGDDRADPRYRRAVLARLADPDLSGRVRVHGALPPERTAAFYAASDVFVLPSVREPYGTVYGEAMAAGLPVVGWNAGNLPHLARSGHEGLVVPTGDVNALAEALLRLVEHPNERRRLGQAARQRASNLPTWDDSAALLFSSLRRLAHRGRRTVPRDSGGGRSPDGCAS